MDGIVHEMTRATKDKEAEGRVTSKTLLASLQIGSAMWADPVQSDQHTGTDTSRGNVHATPCARERPSLPKTSSADRNGQAAFATTTTGAVGAVSLYEFCDAPRWLRWKKEVFSRPLVPTDDQWSVIESVHERLVHEKTAWLKAYLVLAKRW